MKKAFVTGITGTVAPYLKDVLIENGYQVLDTHFRINEESDLTPLKQYLTKQKPDAIFHLALGPFSYAQTLAEYAKKQNILFVYISTVSVFEENSGGPYTKDTKVTVTNDYGTYKYKIECLVKEIYNDSFIIRIGWQISDRCDETSNNMFSFIKHNLNEQNEIQVSDSFYPSTSFIPDTVNAIVDIATKQKPDLYLVNSNTSKSLYEILIYLTHKYDLDITVKKDHSFSRNDIMIDDRVTIPKF